MAKKKPTRKVQTGKKKPVKRSSPKKVALAPSYPVCDFTEAMERVGGDQLLLSQVLAIFHDEIPRMLKNLREYSKKKLPRELWNEAHKMKGASSHFGGAELVELLSHIEGFAKAEQFKNVSSKLKDLENAVIRFKDCVSQWPLPSGGTVIV